MVVLNKIYTRTGDKGETALGDGSRRPKHDARVDAYGTVDETNATIGMARLHAEGDMDAALARIQNDLFDLGADLCRPDMAKDAEAEYPPLRMAQEQVDRLEAEIDVMNKALEPLRSFILPGGAPPCRPPAPDPHRLAPRRASGDRPRHPRRREPGGGEIPEPPVRLVLRRRACRQ